MKIKKWCKEHLNTVTFIMLCMFSAIVYSQFISGHYATDTYNIWQVGYDKYIKNWYLTDGRIFSATFLFIIKNLKISIEAANTISMLLAIVISNIAVMQIVKWTQKYVNIKNLKSQIFLVLICYTIIWNFMYVENMCFLESSVMALSVLCYTLSAIVLVERKKNSFLKSLLFAILGIVSYQGTVGFMFILTAVLTFIKNPRDYKRNAIDVIISGIIAGIAVGVDLCVIKIAENVFGTTQTRLSNFSQIFANIEFILLNIIYILETTCNLYPQYLFIIFTIVTFGIAIVNQIKNYNGTIKKKEKESVIFCLLFLIIFAICSSSVTYAISLTGFWAGRLRFAMGSLLGVMYLYIYAQTDLFNNIDKKFLTNILQIVFIVYFLSTVFFNVFMMSEHKKVNKLEQVECDKILEYVEQYEKNNNIVVSKIQIVTIKGKNEKGYYQETINKNVLTYNAVRADWSAVGCINFYFPHRLIEKTDEIPQEILNEIISSNGDEICIDDTLYVKCYMY